MFWGKTNKDRMKDKLDDIQKIIRQNKALIERLFQHVKSRQEGGWPNDVNDANEIKDEIVAKLGDIHIFAEAHKRDYIKKQSIRGTEKMIQDNLVVKCGDLATWLNQGNLMKIDKLKPLRSRIEIISDLIRSLDDI